MNYYVYFGQNGWPAKFDAIFSYLNDNHCGLRVYGMTTAPLLRDFLFEKSKHKSFYGQLDDSTDLVQKFVGKTADLLDVEKLEEKYGISLWKIIYAERRFITHLHSRRYTTHKFTHQELLNICVGMLHFFENALDNIDYVIMPNPASSWAMGLAIVAENRGIEIRAIRSLSHPNNRAIWGDGPYEKWISVDQEFDKMRLDSNRHRLDLTKEARFLEDFVSHGETPLWLQQTDTQGKISRVVNVSRLTRVIKRIAKGQEGVRSSYAYSPLTFATQLFKFKVNRMLIKGFKNKLFDQPKKGEDFIFYAMHLEPEAALSVNGQHCLNQISLIERMALQMPSSYKLYVKEHPTMVGWRDRAIYAHLRKIPNVKCIDPYLNSEFFLQKAKCILTVNGTIGWEAVLRKKPVVTFGYAFYNNLPQVINCQNLNNIRLAIRESMKFSLSSNSDLDLKIFLKVLSAHSFDLSYNYHWGVGDNNLDAVNAMTKDTESAALALAKSLKL